MRNASLEARGSRAAAVRAPVLVAVALCAQQAVSPVAVVDAQTPITAGYRDFSFGSSAISTPTGEKPESKLWWNDGAWWGVLFNPSANEYRIHRFDAGSQAWSDTGTPVDPRRNSKADVLWDEGAGRLYVVSHVFSNSGKTTKTSSQWGRLYRFAYDGASKRYTRDSGFPITVTRGPSETLTIARDSVQRLWVTWVESSRVKVNWSRAHDLDWGEPVNLPVSSTATGVSSDDISAVLAFGLGSLGVMWSNENTAEVYFAFRFDTDAPETWQPVERVLPGAGCSGACADDHINVKSDGNGRVFAATKTSLTSSGDPLVLLSVREPTVPGTWTSHVVGLERDHHTRPIVLLDEPGNRVHVLATSGETGGAIYLKSSALDEISFPAGLGQPFISSATDSRINNVTSTKQNIDSTTGLLVAASDQDSRFYFHGYIGPGTDPDPEPPPPQPPSAPSGLAASAASSTRVDLTWQDNSANEDSFSVERATLGGAFDVVATLAANASAYSDTTVSPAASYSYRVRARNAAGFSNYSNTVDVTTPDGGGGGGGGEPNHVKSLTFEAGTLVDPASGADKVVGAVAIEDAAPLKGVYSARVPNAASAYLEESFEAADDAYVSAYIRLNALPSGDARIVFLSSAGTTIGNIVVRTSGRLRLRVGSTTVGAESAPLAVGQLHRIGIRQKRGSSGDAILEAYLAAGDAPFGAPFASTSSGGWTTAADRLRIGATSPSAIDLVVDDIRIDAAAMPGPSLQ